MRAGYMMMKKPSATRVSAVSRTSLQLQITWTSSPPDVRYSRIIALGASNPPAAALPRPAAPLGTRGPVSGIRHPPVLPSMLCVSNPARTSRRFNRSDVYCKAWDTTSRRALAEELHPSPRPLSSPTHHLALFTWRSIVAALRLRPPSTWPSLALNRHATTAPRRSCDPTACSELSSQAHLRRLHTPTVLRWISHRRPRAAWRDYPRRMTAIG
ncbi:hypothetical protein DFH06DRAFT_577883 [Mycena polygramma]|nr:hypothetical protein DFH06DRAFT_577883 [Mycena polygramma]